MKINDQKCVRRAHHFLGRLERHDLGNVDFVELLRVRFQYVRHTLTRLACYIDDRSLCYTLAVAFLS